MDMNTNDEQDNNQENYLTTPGELSQEANCEKCGKNPCVCPANEGDSEQNQAGVSDSEDTQAIDEDKDEKKPPKVRWI
jgi:hypothetical protein